MKDKKLKPCKLCMKNPEYNGDYWHCSDKGCPLFETLMKENEWNNLMNTHPGSPQKEPNDCMNVSYNRAGELIKKSQHKESLDLEKVLEEFDKEFSEGFFVTHAIHTSYGGDKPSLDEMRKNEVKDFIRTHWPKPDPRFVEVGKIEWPEKIIMPTHMQSCSQCNHYYRAKDIGYNEAIDACRAAVEKAKGQPHDAD